MWTNIDIDHALIAEAMRAVAQTTKRSTVEEALRRVVATHRKQHAIEDMARLGWDRDPEAMRSGPNA